LRLSQKYDWFLGYAVLVLSILGIVSVVVVSVIPSRWQTADFAQICKGEKSYYYISTLYNAEKRSFSDRAKVYQVLYFGGERLRIVADSRLRDDKKVELVLKLDNAGRKDINLEKVGFLAKFSDQTEQSIAVDKKNQNIKVANSTLLVLTKEFSDDLPGNLLSIDLVISDLNNNCSLTIAKATQINLDKSGDKTISSGGVNVGEFSEVDIPSGLSPVGFSDWRLFAPFYDKEISLLTYDGTSWQEVLQKGDFMAEPGIGYYIYNPRSQAIKTNPSMYFEVPPDVASPKIHPGWNLLYNNQGGDAKYSQIRVTAWPKEEKRRSFIINDQSLDDLIKQGLASDKVYLAGNMVPLGSDQLIPEASTFWFYLFDLPKIQAILPNLDFALSTDKERYDRGSEIALTYKVVNKDAKDHIVDAPKENDPCQVGLEVFNEQGQKIFSEIDDDKKLCPLWPQNLTLGNGEAVEYSRKWQIPSSVKGKIKLRGYFDYTRLNSSDIILSEVEVKVGR